MGKIATTVEEQIDILLERGMIIDDREKAREVLLDIGYYKLGFYCTPFEKDYPKHLETDRQHLYKDGSNFKKVVDLYYFDCTLRDILGVILHRIERNFKTKVCYYASVAHRSNPIWFVDEKHVSKKYARKFPEEVYPKLLKMQGALALKLHHKKYINDKYAPAWKTLEFMTFGAVVKLYESIVDENIKTEIAQSFGVNDISVFLNYIKTMKDLRNLCAHSSVLFDATLPHPIGKGPAKGLNKNNNYNTLGAIRVAIYMLHQISSNRANELELKLSDLIEQNKDINPSLPIFARATASKYN